MEIKIKDALLAQAAQEGMDEFIKVFVDAIHDAIGGELSAETMPKPNADQITLLAYYYLREEVMDGGFIQLIHNGLGGFIFLNPFARAIRELEKDYTDEEFMALFEKYPDFDKYDDAFVESEEEFSEAVARYVDDNIEKFATIDYE